VDDIEAIAPARAVGGAEGAVAPQAAEFLAGWGRTREVRRRVLDTQLVRLAARVGGTDRIARDAAARSVRLASRLEHNELAW
jgi:hypothetical protein